MLIHSFFYIEDFIIYLLYVILLIFSINNITYNKYIKSPIPVKKANINLAFKNSEKHRQAITLHCITPSLEITCTCTFV